jgi:hypothetical protein
MIERIGMCQMTAGIYGVRGKSAICFEDQVEGSKKCRRTSKVYRRSRRIDRRCIEMRKVRKKSVEKEEDILEA